MYEHPPIYLLFDFNALITAHPREWQEYSRVGQCFVPQVVFERIQAIASGKTGSRLEKTAKAFLEFVVTSNWQLSRATATHPQLHPVSSRPPSPAMQFERAIAEAAYGLARASRGRLAILITSELVLHRRIADLQTPNLTALPCSALLLWSRSGRRPSSIAVRLQALRSRRLENPSEPLISRKTLAVAAASSRSVVASAVPDFAVPPKAKPKPSRTVNDPAQAGYQVLTGLSSLVALTIAVGMMWYFTHPKSLNQVLQQNHLPPLPSMATSDRE